MKAPQTNHERLAEFEGNMHRALRSWHKGGGVERCEPALAEMPFEDLLRGDERDSALLARIQLQHTTWQELQCTANALAGDPTASRGDRKKAQAAADEFFARHERDFAFLATLEAADEVNDYDWQQRTIGARLVFRWILAEGFHPLKIMKRLYAVGRAMHVDPFTQLTMEEQGGMFGETKAAVSFRMKVLSGLIKLRGMMGNRLPGQKTPAASASYSGAQMGNHNRANGTKARQGSFLRTLHVPPIKKS